MCLYVWEWPAVLTLTSMPPLCSAGNSSALRGQTERSKSQNKWSHQGDTVFMWRCISKSKATQMTYYMYICIWLHVWMNIWLNDWLEDRQHSGMSHSLRTGAALGFFFVVMSNNLRKMLSSWPEWGWGGGAFAQCKTNQSDGSVSHTRSSMISLTAATTRMKSSGTSVVQRPVGDTSGICWVIQKTKSVGCWVKRDSEGSVSVTWPVSIITLLNNCTTYWCGNVNITNGFHMSA